MCELFTGSTWGRLFLYFFLLPVFWISFGVILFIVMITPRLVQKRWPNYTMDFPRALPISASLALLVLLMVLGLDTYATWLSKLAVPLGLVIEILLSRFSGKTLQIRRIILLSVLLYAVGFMLEGCVSIL